MLHCTGRYLCWPGAFTGRLPLHRHVHVYDPASEQCQFYMASLFNYLSFYDLKLFTIRVQLYLHVKFVLYLLVRSVRCFQRFFTHIPTSLPSKPHRFYKPHCFTDFILSCASHSLFRHFFSLLISARFPHMHVIVLYQIFVHLVFQTMESPPMPQTNYPILRTTLSPSLRIQSDPSPSVSPFI